MDEPWVLPALVLIGGYLMGSVPFGILIARIGGAPDPRSIGSGNIGATNVLRSGRKGLAALTLLLDAAKGAVAVLVARAIDPGLIGLAATGAVLGHLFPLWLRFRGGKGVATALGVTLALHWPTGLIYAAVWLLALAATRISSVGGLSAAVAAPIAAMAMGRSDVALLTLLFALLILWMHRANIGRLIDGTEPRVGGSRAVADPARP